MGLVAKSQRSTWGWLRLIILILALFVVAMNAWLSQLRSTDWDRPLWVVIYPINADQGADTQLYVDALLEGHFDDIEHFMAREARHYDLPLETPLEVYLAPPLTEYPPKPPQNPSMLDSVLWSLNLRYWAWKNDSWTGSAPDIKVYLKLHSPKTHQVLEHSLGLQKGMIGVVNGFASVDYQAQNNFVTIHEVLHTLGATDKYDLSNNQPIWPDGYADPELEPLLPQAYAEVMGGRIPRTSTTAEMPESLEQVLVGEKTAQEINWAQP